jgi:hypothetical protein
MQTIRTIGLDIAKSVYQVHGVDAAGQVVTHLCLLPKRTARTFPEHGRLHERPLSCGTDVP